MKRFITFGSIEQFRTIVKNVQRKAQFVSYNEDTKEVTYDNSAKMPVVSAIGSEKIHGTNASVCYSHPDGFWIQSRKNIITPEKDNAGCAFVQDANRDAWMEIIENLAKNKNIDLSKNIISVYFEWSGGNIQKNSACSGLDKRAIIFQYFKVSPLIQDEKNPEEAFWLDTCYRDEFDNTTAEYWVDNTEKNIFNIMNFPHVQIEIDFDRPDIAQNKMIELVNEIEKESLVGKAFGKAHNIGEGYVFTFEYKGEIFRFKVKGEKHSKGTGKVKTLKPVDEELENKKRSFVNDFACTESRLQQMFTEIVHSVHNGNENEMEMKDMGQFLRLVVNDVIKEETDRMLELGLEPKSINSYISKIARDFFKSKLDALSGL